VGRFDASALARRALKTAGAYALHATGLDRLADWTSGRAREPLVVCYHRVVEDVRDHPSSAPAMLVGRATLERQLDWIGRRYRFVDLDELATAVATGADTGRGRPMAAVTFDDGYADVYRVGFPLLRRKGIPAAVFVPTDWVGTERMHAHDELHLRLQAFARRATHAALARRLHELGVPAPATRGLDGARPEARLLELKEHLLASLPRAAVERLIAGLAADAPIPEREKSPLEPMTWAMLAAMRTAGTVIGSHTRSHRILPNEPEADVAAELVGSKRALEARLGTEVAHLAYPDGQFSWSTVEAACAAGYRYAYTICDHRLATRPLLTISRLTLWERSSAGLVGSFSPAVAACQVHGVFGKLRPCRRDHGVGATRRLKRPRVETAPAPQRAAAERSARAGARA
jgi:peptidoglycan/xylan/chitin deacetylase (PgdA/CDA1 family)